MFIFVHKYFNYTFLRCVCVFVCDINCRLIWLNLGSVDLTLSTIYLIVVVVDVVDVVVVVVVITDVIAIGIYSLDKCIPKQQR